ncbi:MAG: IclR family transcriptional regulator [Rhizobiaceae bacterium]
MGTISKALKLLNYFSIDQCEIGLSEFQVFSGLNKATVYRHLCELQSNGFIEQNVDSKKYRLGPSLLRLATVREQTFPMKVAISIVVDKYSRKLGELVHVSLFDGAFMSPLYHADLQPHGTRVYFNEGELLPMHATSSGLAMLAFGGADILKATLDKPLKKFTGRTLSTRAALKKQVQQSLERGFASCSEGFEKEVFSIATPVFEGSQKCIGTIAIALPLSRLTNETEANIITNLKLASTEVSKTLGGSIPTSIVELWAQ